MEKKLDGDWIMKITPRIVKLIAEIDEFKGYWKGMKRFSTQRLAEMRIMEPLNPSVLPRALRAPR
jgi:hypothetical protein